MKEQRRFTKSEMEAAKGVVQMQCKCNANAMQGEGRKGEG